MIQDGKYRCIKSIKPVQWLCGFKRNKYYKNGGKRIVSSRIYEKCKIEYIKNKKKKKYNDIEKENVSKGTKKAMRTRENINKSISGSKDCKFYYDKIFNVGGTTYEKRIKVKH